MNTPLFEAGTDSPLIGVVGNPNTGKTTLFNALTGLHQHVGNYAGVTVERKEGRLRLSDRSHLDLLDLPGSYTLNGRSPDERIVGEALRNQLNHERPLSAVLVVVDAVHLKRNFNLVSEVLGTGLPCVVAVNMVDIGQSRGIAVDCEQLGDRLGIDVVPVCATRREGLDELIASLQSPRKPTPPPGGNIPEWIETVLDGVFTKPDGLVDSRSDRVDRVLTHPVYGSAVFFAVTNAAKTSLVGQKESVIPASFASANIAETSIVSRLAARASATAKALVSFPSKLCILSECCAVP